MKTLLLLLALMPVDALSKCMQAAPYWEKTVPQSTVDAVIDAVCADNKDYSMVDVGKVTNEWARCLVDGKMIVYLNCKDSKWSIVASGLRFNFSDWEKLKIPKGIR